MGKPLHAQSTNNTKINFSAQNEKLSLILIRLADEANLNFTYDAGDIVFSSIYSYSATDKLPLVILDELLSNTNHTYKQVGNQIVIYKDNTISNVKTTADATTPVLDSKVNSNIIYNVIADTVYIKDTVINFINDTIRIVDTVYVEKQKINTQENEKVEDISPVLFNPTLSRNEGWSASIFIAPIVSNFSLVHEDSELTFRNFSFGVEANRKFDKWGVSVGLKLTQFSEKFNHSYSITEGGYFVTDTIDFYYTVIQTDTAWYYITDSTWSPIDNHEYSYNIKNRVGYIEFGASVFHDYFTKNNLSLYAKIGVQAGIMVYKNGLAIPDANNPKGVDFANLNFSSASYSILLGTGVRYQISEHFDFNSEIYYLNYFTDLVIDYPNNTKVKGVGVRLGLIYYF
jgi:hypothetical protein